MNHINGRPSIIAFAIVAVAALGACSKGSNQYASSGSDTTAIRSDSAAGRADTTTPAATPAPATKGWTDGAIVGFVTAANTGEAELGKLAETKATVPAVKAYARQMVRDHQMMQKEMTALATKLNIVGDSTADDARDLMSHGSDAIKDLTDKAAGTDWDKNYMDKMADDHQKVLDKLQDAAKNTSNTELRTALEKAVGKVQQHLTKAQDIKSKTLKA